MIITIDGPVATGKSTIAKKLASSIGYIYYDTGAMYRAFALDFLKKGHPLTDPEAIKKELEHFDFHIKIWRGEHRYFLGEEDVTDKLRTPAVSDMASKLSAFPEVREKMVKTQREHAQGVNAVFEGRDMGTTVFPNADLKIYLTGRDDVRAKRRFEELQAKYPEECKATTLENVLSDLQARDSYDMRREASPLKKAEDAYEIDTSDLTPDEVVFKILECKDMASARRKTKKTG